MQDYDEEFPKPPTIFTQSEAGRMSPAERIVDQRNLLQETKFTSSLFRPKPVRTRKEVDKKPSMPATAAVTPKESE